MAIKFLKGVDFAAQELVNLGAPTAAGSASTKSHSEGLTTKPRVLFPDGSLVTYATIQEALTAIPAATDSASARKIHRVYVPAGTYDEALSLDIGRKKVVIICEGSVNIGTFGSSNWAVSGTTRNFDVTCSVASIDSIRPSLSIISNTPGDAGTHQAYGHNFRLSGTLNVSNSTGGTSGEIDLRGVALLGWDGTAAGNNASLATGSWAGNLNVYLENVRCYGVISGANARLQGVVNSRLEKLATIATYSRIVGSTIVAGMTWTVAPTEVPPCGIFGTDLAGVFTGASASNLLLDAYSNYSYTASGASVAGGAAIVSIQLLTKAAVGLSNVDNTADTDKPVSTATQTALNLKVNTSDLNAAVDARIAGSAAVVYVGTFDASAGNYTALANASQGDLYRISVAGTIGSEVYKLKDTIVVNNNVTGTPVLADLDHYDNNDDGLATEAFVTNITDVLPRKYTTTIGNGTDTDIVITHNLGTRVIDVSIVETASPYSKVYPDVEATTTTTATIKFATAPTSGQYAVIAVG